ncbi:MAG: R3H domain-containing nucleic acid-binding protein [bacterium]|nr:R3H domain-containing nucleic acid-binding protein [bacterium]
MSNYPEKIKKITKEFFKKADFLVDASIEEEKGTLFVKIKTDDPQILIGQNGQTLAEIQKLLRALVKKSIEGEFFIDVDINNYKQKKAEYLKETAREAANEVFLSQKEKTLPAMPSYERRVVHVELADRSDVVVESIGEEPNRRIVIKPTLS